MADPVVVDEARQKAGREILSLTDRAGFDAYAAAWLHDRETGAWRYVLVTPMLQTHGPRWIYERLLRLFQRHSLPDGISPLDIYVIDPSMETAAFGEPVIAIDESDVPAGIQVMALNHVRVDDLLVGDGFAAFYRRLPNERRAEKHDPARKFDLRVRQLEAA
jgi:hypothetical protein